VKKRWKRGKEILDSSFVPGTGRRVPLAEERFEDSGSGFIIYHCRRERSGRFSKVRDEFDGRDVRRSKDTSNEARIGAARTDYVLREIMDER